MRIYLSILCLVFSALSYGNDLISGYQWRPIPVFLIENIPKQHDPQTNQNSASITDEHNSKLADSDITPNETSLDCKQDENKC